MSEETRKEWEDFKQNVIPKYKDRLSHLEEEKSELDKKKKDIILELANKCEKFMACEEIARFLAVQLEGIVTKRWVEEVLGKTQKRSYDRYQDQEKRTLHISNDDNINTIEVSTSGSQSVTGPDGKEREQEIEVSQEHDIQEEREFLDWQKGREIQQTENAIMKKDKQELENRLKETFRMIEDKDNVIEKLRVQMGNLEIEVAELKRKTSSIVVKKVDESKEDLQIKYDELKQAYEDLRQVETLRTKQQDFTAASGVGSPKQVWVAAVHAFSLYKGLKDGSMWATSHNEPWKKVIFDIASDGQLKNARLEGT